MSEPPRKKFRQSSILDLFGRRKTNPSEPIQEKTSVDNNKEDKAELSQSTDGDIVDLTCSDEMSDYDERRAKTAAAAERRRKENSLSPSNQQQQSNRPGTTLPSDRGTPGKQGPVGGPDASPTKDLPAQMASATLEYSQQSLPGSESQNSDGSLNIEEFSQSPARQKHGDRGATSKAGSSGRHAKKKRPRIPNEKPKLDEIYFKGTAIDELKRTPACSPKYPPSGLKTTSRHTVLVKMPVTADVIPKPSYSTYTDEWSGSYVRMPCSTENIYPVDGANGTKDLRPRWELIEAALLKLVGGGTTSRDLERAILSYNSRYEKKWDFSDLHTFFNEHLEEVECEEFFKNTLPAMVELALQLPYLCTQPIPLLKANEEHAITLSQQQVACLLANAFFCTFPRRNAKHKHSEYSSYPSINFNDLFQGSGSTRGTRKVGKLKCLLNYFRRVTTSMPTGTVTFHRQIERYTDFPLWAKSDTRLSKLHISANGTIEDQGEGMLQVDFANKFIGGGVLRTGCVQEEIRFIICPELILSRLFTECLEANECLIMTGCERYSYYGGYANSFKWTGDYYDDTPRDSWGRRYINVVALDAIRFAGNTVLQFSPDSVRRELNKAYVGFLDRQTAVSQMQAVATGNWGCGAFGGDVNLKVLIQLMAASEVKRDLCYFTFGDKDLVDAGCDMYEFLKEKDASLSTVWDLISQYYTDICYSGAVSSPKTDLFEYIHKLYNDYDGSTDEGSSPVRHNSQELWDSEANMADIMADIDRYEQEEETKSSQASGS